MLDVARSVMASLVTRGERFFVPAAVRPGGHLDEQATRLRYVRIVCVIAASSVGVFAPSLPVAGVPLDRWLVYLLAAVARGGHQLPLVG
jgi:hypothetical protein